MHGVIHSELKRYIEVNHESGGWGEIVEEAGLSDKLYTTVGTYPDDEIHAIVGAASALTGAPKEDILEDFGEFLAPTLMSMYKSLIKPEWGTMEMLMNAEDTMHRVVRMKKPGADPPRLNFEKKDSNTLKLVYDSPRRMSAVAKGIIRGVADHYDDEVRIQERKAPEGGSEMQIRVV